MIVKILSSASKNFFGVQYNDKKVEQGKGELLSMENFPDFIDENASQQEVRDYLKAISSQNEKIKKPQFHAVISTKFQEHSKEELGEIGKEFMKKMGYKNQPYIIVFHNDTENNHIHIVSTRVEKHNGKKINDSFEKLRSQEIMSNIISEKYGEEKDLEKVNKLLGYQYSNFSQLGMLLQRNGFKIFSKDNLVNDENKLLICKRGLKLREISSDDLTFNNALSKQTKNQLKAIFIKYREKYSNEVFKIIDNRENEGLNESFRDKESINDIKIDFDSEFQEVLRKKIGIDIIFHHKQGKIPFGYSIIDHKRKAVYKGSEVMKMKELFSFSDRELDKRNFERLKDFNIENEKDKNLLQKRYSHLSLKEFMLFENKNNFIKEVVKKQIYNDLLDENNKEKEKKHIIIGSNEDNVPIFIHDQYHKIGKVKEILNFEEYMVWLENNKGLFKEEINSVEEIEKGLESVIEGVEGVLDSKSSMDDEWSKKKRKKKR